MTRYTCIICEKRYNKSQNAQRCFLKHSTNDLEKRMADAQKTEKDIDFLLSLLIQTREQLKQLKWNPSER